MSVNDFNVTIVIAAKNEEDVLELVVREIYEICKNEIKGFEIFIVNDGSEDSTGNIAQRLAEELSSITVINNKQNEGLGAAFRKVLGLSSYEYFMLLCGDGGLPASSLPKIFNLVGEADIIIPYMLNLQRIKTKQRYKLSKTYTMLMNKLFGLKLNYYNGLPIYPTKLLKSIDIKSEGFGFQAEILIKLIKSGASYLEVGVLGSEITNKSSALSFKNILNILVTFFTLIYNLTIDRNKSNIHTHSDVLD